MLILTAAAQTRQPDYVALAMVLVLALVVAVMAVRKKMTATAKQPSPESVPSPGFQDLPAAPGSAGKVRLYDVEPKVAAMLMAITADKMGKPLNELRFISIREVKHE